MTSIADTSLWLLFGLVISGLLALDLFVFHRKAHVVRTREALTWSGVWVGVALIFDGAIYWLFGSERGLEFLTGYTAEKALAVDNLFVFAVVFSYLGIPRIQQHRVLFWGVIGAVLFRALFISVGGLLLVKFHWVAYVFGALLVLTGIKLLRRLQVRPESNPLFRMLRRIIPTTNSDQGEFVVRRNGRLLATPLLLSLVLVEISDVVFALDSIPAIFAITSDQFIVFTSNIFAVLGMRALYSLLADFLVRLKFLHVGLAVVLVFVGAKMLLSPLIKVPVIASLAVVVGVIGGSAFLSLLAPSLLWRARHGLASNSQRHPPFLISHERPPTAGSRRPDANRLGRTG
ncbi:MAG TPA: TerC family protein [Candidatus Sulfotelmatobacter sp.]|nr:TerC family protein [Candidatus Sulfotelmatobacter sp.]